MFHVGQPPLPRATPPLSTLERSVIDRPDQSEWPGGASKASPFGASGASPASTRAPALSSTLAALTQPGTRCGLPRVILGAASQALQASEARDNQAYAHWQHVAKLCELHKRWLGDVVTQPLEASGETIWDRLVDVRDARSLRTLAEAARDAETQSRPWQSFPVLPQSQSFMVLQHPNGLCVGFMRGLLKWQGKGTVLFSGGGQSIGSFSGVLFSGVLSEPSQEGQGVTLSPLGWRYDGAFCRNTFNGWGRMTFGDGSCLTGHWAHGAPVDGVLLLADGTRIEGRFSRLDSTKDVEGEKYAITCEHHTVYVDLSCWAPNPTPGEPDIFAVYAPRLARKTKPADADSPARHLPAPPSPPPAEVDLIALS